MATKKRKRFNEGGFTEAQDKAAGLEASKDEKVGFFERLRMGNIDQEGSEAYNRFGAGRAKADRARAESKPSTSVYRVDSGPGSLGMSDEDKPSTNVYRVDSGPGKLSTGATKVTPTKRPAASAPTKTESSPSRTSTAAERRSAIRFQDSQGATKPSTNAYRVDSAPGKLAQQEQSYTRKMGATAEEIAKPYTRKMGATAEEMAKPYDRSVYKPRRSPEPLTSTRKPGTRTNYENEDATSETFKKGGSVKGWGIARGARKAKIV